MRIVLLSRLSPYPFRDQLTLVDPKPTHPYPWVINLAEALVKYQHQDVHIITIDPQIPYEQTIQRNNVTYHFLPQFSKISRALTLFQNEKLRIKSKLKELKPDIINPHFQGSYSMAALEYNKNITVVTFHVPLLSYLSIMKSYHSLLENVQHYVTLLSEKSILKYSRNIICVSPYTKAILENNFPQKNYYIVENAINEVYFNKYKRGAENEYAIFVGSLTERKGVYWLLEVLSKTENINIKFITTYINHAVKEKFLHFAKKYNVENRIKLISQLTPEDLAKQMGQSKYLVLPSIYEVAPMVISEAMAQGIPIISTDVGGITNMVFNDINGFIVKYGNLNQFAEKMQLLWDNRELNEFMGAKSRELAQRRYHPYIVAEKTMNVYNTILGMK